MLPSLSATVEALAARQGWAVADDSQEGVRLSFGEADGDGWLLLRLSVHDPVMPLNIESNRSGGCREIAQKIATFLHGQSGLDCARLDAYLEGGR